MTVTQERVGLSKIDVWVCESCMKRTHNERSLCNTPGCVMERRHDIRVCESKLLKDLVDYTREGG